MYNIILCDNYIRKLYLRIYNKWQPYQQNKFAQNSNVDTLFFLWNLNYLTEELDTNNYVKTYIITVLNDIFQHFTW